MRYKENIPGELFDEEGHYLGRPADFDAELVVRRIKLVKEIPDFTGKDYSLLDIGCGNGASMFVLSRNMKNCVGIDITNEHEDEFNSYKVENNIKNCQFKVLDVVENEAKEKFDRIISFEVIEHLADESGVRYYFDSLKDDGIMAISVPNKWWPFETHGAKLPLLPWNRVPFFSWLPRPIHERFANARIYTKSRIGKLLEKNGFEVISYQYITTPLDVLPDSKFKFWLLKNIFNTVTTKMPIKAPAIFIVAKKRKLKDIDTVKY